MSTASVFNHNVGSLIEIKDFYDAASCKNKTFKVCFNKILTKNNNLVGIIGLFNAKENKNEPEMVGINIIEIRDEGEGLVLTTYKE